MYPYFIANTILQWYVYNNTTDKTACNVYILLVAV